MNRTEEFCVVRNLGRHRWPRPGEASEASYGLVCLRASAASSLATVVFLGAMPHEAPQK